MKYTLKELRKQSGIEYNQVNENFGNLSTLPKAAAKALIAKAPAIGPDSSIESVAWSSSQKVKKTAKDFHTKKMNEVRKKKISYAGHLDEDQFIIVVMDSDDYAIFKFGVEDDKQKLLATNVPDLKNFSDVNSLKKNIYMNVTAYFTAPDVSRIAKNSKRHPEWGSDEYIKSKSSEGLMIHKDTISELVKKRLNRLYSNINTTVQFDPKDPDDAYKQCDKISRFYSNLRDVFEKLKDLDKTFGFVKSTSDGYIDRKEGMKLFELINNIETQYKNYRF